jgi:hypothetical protein
MGYLTSPTTFRHSPGPVGYGRLQGEGSPLSIIGKLDKADVRRGLGR